MAGFEPRSSGVRKFILCQLRHSQYLSVFMHVIVLNLYSDDFYGGHYGLQRHSDMLFEALNEVCTVSYGVSALL